MTRGSLPRLAFAVVALALLHEALAQLMLGRPIMAQLLSPSLWAAPALAMVLVTLLLRLFLLVGLPAVAAYLLVTRLTSPSRNRGKATW
jgi:hypothetical protein